MTTQLNRLPEETYYDKVLSPIGELYILASTKGVSTICWDLKKRKEELQYILATFILTKNNRHINKAKTQLKEYFQGKRQKFSVKVDLHGTPFQQEAWKQLINIPYGKTISYHEQARCLGDTKKARAVGGANSRNPLPIIVPCHRVIAKSGHLTGFAGGLKRKAFLLELEKQY